MLLAGPHAIGTGHKGSVRPPPYHTRALPQCMPSISASRLWRQEAGGGSIPAVGAAPCPALAVGHQRCALYQLWCCKSDLSIPARHRQLHCCRPVANPTRDGALVTWSSMSRLSVSSSSHLRLAQQQAPRRCHVVTRVCPNACRLANAAHGAHWPPTLSHHDAFAMPQAAVPGRRQMVPMVS